MCLLGEPLLKCCSLECAAPCVREELHLDSLVDGGAVLREQMAGQRWGRLHWSGRGDTAWPSTRARSRCRRQTHIGRTSTQYALCARFAGRRVDRSQGEQALVDSLLALGRLVELSALLKMLVLASRVFGTRPSARFAAGAHALQTTVWSVSGLCSTPTSI